MLQEKHIDFIVEVTSSLSSIFSFTCFLVSTGRHGPLESLTNYFVSVQQNELGQWCGLFRALCHFLARGRVVHNTQFLHLLRQ
jgi:hypothetical protein